MEKKLLLVGLIIFLALGVAKAGYFDKSCGYLYDITTDVAPSRIPLGQYVYVNATIKRDVSWMPGMQLNVWAEISNSRKTENVNLSLVGSNSSTSYYSVKYYPDAEGDYNVILHVSVSSFLGSV